MTHAKPRSIDPNTTVPMKRYLVFGYCQYYPAGGSNDVIGDFETLEEARAAAKGQHDDYDILDMQERCWVISNVS